MANTCSSSKITEVNTPENAIRRNLYNISTALRLLIFKHLQKELEPMTCLECEKELSYMDHRRSMDLFRAELCPYHRKRLERLLVKSELPVEAVILYYGLRQVGIRPMLAWWDGKKTVDLAISRVRLNVEIDRGYESLSHQQAMQELESNLYAFRDGFTHIRIPRPLIRNHVGETVHVILRVMEGLREKSRVV